MIINILATESHVFIIWVSFNQVNKTLSDEMSGQILLKSIDFSSKKIRIHCNYRTIQSKFFLCLSK